MDDFSEESGRLTKSEEFSALHDDLKTYQQTEHVNKITISKSRRQIRRKIFLGTSTFFNPDKDIDKLFAAVNNHNVEAVESLLKDGVSANCCDHKMRTPLHFATAYSDELIVKSLLQYGADPNKKDVSGSTSLHLAACCCNITIVTLLLQHGANIRMADGMGKNPMQLSIGKLKCFKDNSTHSPGSLKHQISLVISLMQAFIKEGVPKVCDILDVRINQLEVDGKEDEIIAIGELLDNLNNLHIDTNSQ